MPAAPRDPKSKATKIAFKIMGKPVALLRDVNPKTKTQKRLVYEETKLIK